MRILTITILLALTYSLSARDMFVVINTSERVVLKYLCEGRLSPNVELPYQRTVIFDRGRVSWHVVGGVAPFTMVDQILENGNICITVVDAAGTMATGCAMVVVRTEIVWMDCPTREEVLEEQRLRAEMQEQIIRTPRRGGTPSGGGSRGPRTAIRVASKGGGGSGGNIRSTFSSRSSGSNGKGGGRSGGGAIRYGSTGR